MRTLAWVGAIATQTSICAPARPVLNRVGKGLAGGQGHPAGLIAAPTGAGEDVVERSSHETECRQLRRHAHLSTP
jgi:hypothetical protein